MPRLAIVIGLLVGHYYSIAYAFEGDLILPEKGKSNVVFELRNEQASINPSDVFQVFVGNLDACCEGKSAIAGSYSISGHKVTFVPAFDFIEGQNYTVKISGESAVKNGTRLLNEFTIERSIDHVSPEIVGIFPSGADIPENTLRFYIHFSTAMRPHVSTDYIKLLDAATGTPDTAAFMSLKQELWSEDRKRLTLLMDPGRIKRGVDQNLLLGPALQEGSAYSIVVERGWSTANDAETMPAFERVFTVSKPLRTLPDSDLWTIVSPRNMTDDPLIIEFDRPFDSQLLPRGISVLDDVGRPVPGVISIENQERRWRFDRKGVWSNSQIQITVDTELEDVAGNNFIELLDHSVGTEKSVPNKKIIAINLELSPI